MTTLTSALEEMTPFCDMMRSSKLKEDISFWVSWSHLTKRAGKSKCINKNTTNQHLLGNKFTESVVIQEQHE
jgi:hypothetical protein